MTDKRFKIYQDMYENLYIEDKETGVGIGVGNEEDVRYNTVSEIVQLLNELHEEKEVAIEGIMFADKLIEDLGGEEMKNQWRKKFRKRRIKE